MLVQDEVLLPARRSEFWTTVLESWRETPTTHAVRLSRPADFDFRASAVAWLFLDTREGEEVRPMSLASSPTRDYLEFAVRLSEGPYKRAFAALRPGDTVRLAGPFGHFYLQEDRPAIMLAGGIGITPLKSMIEYATDAALPTDITLLYSNRSPQEIVFQKDLHILSAANPHLKIIYTISRVAAPDWQGRQGRIDGQLIADAAAHQPAAVFYVCGTPAMVTDLLHLLWLLRVPPEQVRRERFIGYGTEPL